MCVCVGGLLKGLGVMQCIGVISLYYIKPHLVAECGTVCTNAGRLGSESLEQDVKFLSFRGLKLAFMMPAESRK